MPDAISAGFPFPRRTLLKVTENEVIYLSKF